MAAQTVQARQPLALDTPAPAKLGGRDATGPGSARRGVKGWFDCLIGCAVAASMAGVKAPGETAAGRQRERYTQDDLRRKDTWPNL